MHFYLNLKAGKDEQVFKDLLVPTMWLLHTHTLASGYAHVIKE